jgi:hypothetical protein
VRHLALTIALGSALGACTPRDRDATRDASADALDASPDTDELDAASPLDAAPDAPRDHAVIPLDAEVHHASVSVGPIHLDVGEEKTECVSLRVGLASDQLIRAIHARLGPASHHLIVYRDNGTTENTTPTPCAAFEGIRDPYNPVAPLMIAQQVQSDVVMPDDPAVGLPLAAGALVTLEYHVINTTGAPVDASATVDFDTIDPVPEVMTADLMFWGTMAINVPPHATATADFANAPPAGANIFALTTHEHRLGTTASIDLEEHPDDAGVRAAREVYRSTSWSDAPLQMYDPPLQLADGQQLHLRCSYLNTTDQYVSYGESANDEMCFMWAYYYPSQGLKICFDLSASVRYCSQ